MRDDDQLQSSIRAKSCKGVVRFARRWRMHRLPAKKNPHAIFPPQRGDIMTTRFY
jgi:hypothetical protein